MPPSPVPRFLFAAVSMGVLAAGCRATPAATESTPRREQGRAVAPTWPSEAPRWWATWLRPDDRATAHAGSSPGCPTRPDAYTPALGVAGAQSPEEAVQRGARVLEAAWRALLAGRESLLRRPVSWTANGVCRAGDRGITVCEGHYAWQGGPQVPAYLLLPAASDGVCTSRGGVLVLHGHDRGRREVVDHPEGYQKAIAVAFARAGFTVLAPDQVSWGDNDPLGDGHGKHSRDWTRYRDALSDYSNGFLTWDLTELSAGITLLLALRVDSGPGGRCQVAPPGASGAQRAAEAVAVAGLSFGGVATSWLVLDPRPAAYVVAGGLIDTCAALRSKDHHECQHIAALDGRVAIWDALSAAALVPRPAAGCGAAGHPARVIVQEGLADPILGGWTRRGMTLLAHGPAVQWGRLELQTDEGAGHTWLVEPAVDAVRTALEDAVRCNSGERHLDGGVDQPSVP